MSAAVDSLTNKVGPLPVWAWSAGVAVLIVGYQRLRPQPESATEEVVEEFEPVTGGAAGPFTMSPSPLGGGSWAVAPLAQQPGDGIDISTDEAWRAQVASWAVNVAGYDALVVLNGLNNFLDGQPMTDEQVAMVKAALVKFGEPPTGAPTIIRITPTPTPVGISGGTTADGWVRATPTPVAPTPVAPTPVAPAPAPAPAADTVRTIGTGDTLYRMYRSVYGSNPSVRQVQAIASRNGLSVGPGPNYVVSPFRSGQTIRFPPTQP